ncbi:MAG: EF-hand domain-containing protein [Burkholderiaceae bacterium]|nr:EF-hand domain-containing protein [Pseudomonadota bacterium]MBS0598963.1 EF-hand domain-containing protein [Pseudomonadota bacterium]MCP5219899.1 EF-hand domain-containing protein [Burkholderiaceae bacterium]
MFRLRAAAALLTGALAGAAALAQSAPNAPSAPAAPPATAARTPSRGEAQALQLFNMLDADGDGRISRAEAQVAIRIKPSLAELFERTDTNHDGYLTQDEIRAEAARQRAERQARRQREATAAGTMSRP